MPVYTLSHFISSIYIHAFETGSLYVALAGLQVSMQTRLASNSEKYAWLCLFCLPSTGIKVMFHHTSFLIFNFLLTVV